VKDIGFIGWKGRFRYASFLNGKVIEWFPNWGVGYAQMISLMAKKMAKK